MSPISHCCVPMCSNDSRRRNDISFHCFPSESNLRNEWLSRIKHEHLKIGPYTRVCSVHFQPDDIRKSLAGRKFIIPGTLPSIFPWTNGKKEKIGSKVMPPPRKGLKEEMGIPKNPVIGNAQRPATMPSPLPHPVGISTQPGAHGLSIPILLRPGLELRPIPGPEDVPKPKPKIDEPVMTILPINAPKEDSSGKKFRSKPQLARHLGEAVDLTSFDFRTGKINSLLLRKTKRQRGAFDYSRGGRTDTSLVPPIRQTASIFKQPVTVIKTQESKVKTDFKHGPQDKPKQLFWEKRLQDLRACGIEEDELQPLRLPSNLKPVGPNVNEDTLLQSVATALHVGNLPIVGQTGNKLALEKNPGVYINPEQPLVQALVITEDDIYTQEERVQSARKRLEKALNSLNATRVVKKKETTQVTEETNAIPKTEPDTEEMDTSTHTKDT